MNNPSSQIKRRVLLKISGETLLGSMSHGINGEALQKICERIVALHRRGCHIALVVGGGNIFRGIQSQSALRLERTPADHMGMLATMINGIAVSETLNAMGSSTTLMSSLDCPDIAERFQWHRALNLFDKGEILLFSGGTGHPYFTTDTAAALRGCELGVDILLKATLHVDGIYDRDPRLDPQAKKYARISYTELIEKKLGAMDLTAVTMCMGNKIPIRVFNLKESFEDALCEDKRIGTLVTE